MAKKNEKTSEMYVVSADRPCPTPRRARSARLTNTMSTLKSGESFEMPGVDWYALKTKLGTSPGTYTYRRDKVTDMITVWKI